MNLWTEAQPTGSGVWVMPREMYDCVCICAMNKSGKDVIVELDYSESKAAELVGGSGPSSSSSPTPSSSAQQQLTTRCFVAARQTTVVAMFRPSQPFTPMQVSYKPYLVAVANKEDAAVIDADGARLLMNSANQSAEVESWLRSRRRN